MLCDLMPCDLPRTDAPVGYVVRRAVHAFERDAAFALRRAVFCAEQGVFVGDDRDPIDDAADLLVAVTCVGGMPDQVVGTVRIHHADDRTWWGSRLAVHPSFRHQGHLGATLIRLAVSLAHARGCTAFLAHVQAQNVAMFERLHWTVVEQVVLHGRPHARMRADLSRYPPVHDAASGFVTRSRAVA